VGQRLEWADISPYRAVLYLVDDENPFNKQIASVAYDHEKGSFLALLHRSNVALSDAQIDIPTKVEAMEAAMALLVASRFDKAN